MTTPTNKATITKTTTTKATAPKAPAASDIKVTPESSKIESPVIDPKAKDGSEPAKSPVNLEVESPSAEPEKVDAKQESVRIQTDVREKLNKKTDEDVFVPSNPAALEKAATAVATEQGFELTRGTSIGARLIARAQKRA